MIGRLQDEVCGHYMFQVYKTAIDKRPKEIECKECDKTFTNRLKREHHDKSSHGGERTKDIAFGNILSGFAGTLKDVSGTLKDVSGTIKDVMINNTEKKTT